MASENKILDLSFPAAEDLSSDQYRFVVLDAAGKVRRPDSETEIAVGILQNGPSEGEAAAVRIAGVSKLEAAEAMGIGAFVMPEFVSNTDAGKGKASTGAPAYTRALVLDSSGAEGDLASVLLLGAFPAVNDAVARITTVTSKSTAGAVTYSAAELAGGLILRDSAGAGRSDVTPAAAAIVAAIPGCVVGSSFEFSVRNTADGDETITLTAGSGVTLSGTMTIGQSATRRLLAVVTAIDSGSEAVTIYSLGTVVH